MNIKRIYVPNAIVFITQVVDRRTPIFREERYVDLLRKTLANVKEIHPFKMLAYVFLPDHFHLLIKPSGISYFDDIMHSLKPNFTKEYKKCLGITASMKFWQKGYWDHIIRDEEDLQDHLDYIHYNPVHHGFVDKPEAWTYSSFRYWQARDAYPAQWGWTLPTVFKNKDWSSSEADHA